MSFSRVDRDKFLQYLCEHRTDIKSNRRDPNSFWGKCCREFKLKNNFKNRNWLYWTFMNNRKNVKQDYESNQKMDNAQDSIDENLREQVSHDMKYHTNKKGNDCGTQEVSTNLQGDTTSNEHFISYLTETCVDDKIIEGNTNNKETFANFDDSDFPLFCICKMPNDGRPYVQCDKCHDWFHFECINYCDTPTQRDMPYFCPKCETDSPCSLMSNNNVENFQEPNLDINTNEEIAKHQFKDESLTNTSDSDEKSIKIEIPKKFKIYLTPEEYTQVQPTNTKRCLQGEWTTLLNTKFYEHNKACVLRFFYNRIKKPDSRKKKCKFLSVKATCKFDGCSSYTFTRKKVPSTNRKISIKVKRLGKINHSFKDMKMRKTTGSERKQLGEILQNKSTNEWYYESCSQMDNVSIQAGNVTPCKNQVVLHKIASEYRKSGLLHPDPLTEVMILQGLYKETFHEEPSGFIQYFACNPFKIILYTRDQLELFLSINKSKRENVLYFDATGSIFKKIPGQDKRILYYSLVMQNPVAGKSVLPLAEMITNDHHMSEIRHFLSRIIMNLKSISSQYLPNFIVTDFSWALIQSVLSAFNNEDIKKYLQRSVAIIQGQIPVKEITSYTYPYLCAAHMVKNFSQSLKNREKPIREFALFIFGLFQNCSDLKEATCLFKHACILFCTKFQTCNVRNSLTYLRKTIYSQHIEVCADDEMREMEEELNDNQNWKTIRDSSWYFHKFKRIQEETEIKEISSEKENVYFDVNIISILLNKYLYILPLWSGIMKKIILQTSNKLKTNETLRYTNNPVENWFGVIKKDLLVHQQRLRVGDFIKKELTNIKGRLGEVKIYTRKKSIKEETEKWNKRKRNKTGPKYYTQPLCMPEPKPKKGKNTSNKTQILQVTHEPQNPITQDIQFDFSNIPAWGGEGIVNQKIVKLINTCPIDNLVYIFCCLCADRKDIQELLINTNDEVCQTVVQMYQLGEKHSWNAAKILWLKNACKLNFDSNYIDLYGSEEEYFVQHLHFIMCTQSISKCSNPECKKPEICFKSNEINLPAPMGLPKTIQNMFDKWWAGMTTECGRLMHKQNTKHEEPTHCEGTRSVSKRSFVNFNGKPPFLLTQPYYFEKKRKTTAIIMNDIEVARQRYCLYAMTLHKGDHFTAVLHRPNGWYFYDGLHTLLKGPVEKYDSLTKGLNFNYLLYVRK